MEVSVWVQGIRRVKNYQKFGLGFWKRALNSVSRAGTFSDRDYRKIQQ